ncbi:MAG: cytidylate kinase [Nitrospirae bacterium CG_4_10_14_0_8_um_filter_41_23]|nr:MAG: cytidylate kinase [Nitrospirae bacterium CG_4_10_14_0_8_um_filter_41_23]PJA79991.1 MAG: cytidylate kinase [Nitrospirae bacterium CG_4_9_14_3_um_filter_41_27]
MKKVIAIDGPSGSGKTTIAKLIAKELGFNYLDTGALYRAAALALKNNGINIEDSDDRIRDVLNKTNITFSNGRVFLNGKDISEDIRSKEIDHYSSVFSARKVVRDFLLHAQRDNALDSDLVIEGRDTTTVVFPDAKKKIYLDASVKERAKRRCLQFREKGIDISMDESKRNITERDKRDSSRDIAPLKIAPGALLVDSSNLSIGQVTKKILDFVKV